MPEPLKENPPRGPDDDAQGRELVRAALAVSEHVLRAVWDHPDDADYDRLPA